MKNSTRAGLLTLFLLLSIASKSLRLERFTKFCLKTHSSKAVLSNEQVWQNNFMKSD